MVAPLAEMTWTKLSDTILGDPKLMNVGLTAELAYIRALVYANRHETDGFIPAGAMPEVCRGFEPADAEQAPLRLVRVGLWQAVPGGHQVAHYLDYQRSKKKIDADRAANALRQARFKSRQRAEAEAVASPNGVTGDRAEPKRGARSEK